MFLFQAKLELYGISSIPFCLAFNAVKNMSFCFILISENINFIFIKKQK